MGLLSDFLRFVGSVVLGRKDAGQEFREALSMGERYVRWGEERQDIRDYAAAIEQFDRCNDQDAPRPDLVVRKYTGLLQAAAGIAELHLRKYRVERGEAEKAAEELVRELKTVAGQIEVSKGRIQTLKSEGSLIKAKDEERRLEELKARHAALQSRVEKRDLEEEVAAAYDRVSAEVERVCRDLEMRMVGLEMLPETASAAITSLREQVQKRVDTLRSALAELKPGVSGPPPSGDDAETTAGNGATQNAEQG